MGVQSLDDLRTESEKVKEELQSLLNSLVNENEDVLADVHPMLKTDYKTIKKQIKTQKDENEQLIKQLIQLRKETGQTKQQISLCNLRINELEKILVDQNKAIPLQSEDMSNYEYDEMQEDEYY
jgi:hypothetical protein